MRRFISRALEKLPKLDETQIEALRDLISEVTGENELYDVVFDSLTDGVVVLDTDHRVLLHNKSSDRLLSLPSGELYKERLWSVVPDSEISQFFRQNLVNQERVHDREFSLDNGGALRIISCSIMPLVRVGRVQGNLIHVEEVTEKRSEEARLRRAENLAALTTLAAGVAHEIKNPLGSIGIHLQLIQKALAASCEPVDGDMTRYLDVIQEEVDRLNRIVVDFLFAVRPMDAVLEPTDLNRVVSDLIEFVHFELENESIQIVSNLDENLPKINLDEKFIKQALLNVVNNAASAMPDGGTLTVTTDSDGGSANLSVIDTGLGISESNMAKIFEPYFTTKEFGSGLGLTVVYKIIKEHQGDISLESKEGKGTKFTMSFPIPQREKRLLQWKESDGDI